LLQPPQWSASVLGSTQAAHITRGAAQVATHDPSTQACPATQTRPQAPQWAGLLRVSTSQPLASTPSQSARPGLHVSAHDDPTHSALLSGRAAHDRPQALQLATVLSGASQPFTGSPSQSPAPAVQRIPQRPISQVAVAIGPEGHARPHAPQFVMSPSTFRQRPSQRSWPGAQAGSSAATSAGTSSGASTASAMVTSSGASGGASAGGASAASRPSSEGTSAGVRSRPGRSPGWSGAGATSSFPEGSGWLSAHAAQSSANTSHRTDRIVTPPASKDLSGPMEARSWRSAEGEGIGGDRISPGASRAAAR
jgi:hypothetical protein